MVDPRILERLDGAGIRYCLIGAAALAARGYARFSVDVDLLTVDRTALMARIWEGFQPRPELREGDSTDPLQGVVRFGEPLNTDVVVGKGHAAQLAVETAERLPGIACPVPTALALLLNKLEAGGGKDQQDILSLVDAQRALNGAPWLDEVAAHLPQLSRDARKLWARLAPQLGP